MADKLNIRTIIDNRGNLSVIEDAPFDIKRVYYLHGVGDRVVRGGHAQRKTDRLLIAVSGSFKATVCEPGGRNWNTTMLWEPTSAMHIYPGEWLELNNFSSGAVCLVLASEKYDEADSVRDFKDFLHMREAA